MNIDPHIFRAYDIRGVAKSQLQPEVVYALGQAIGSLTLEEGGHEIVCGQDGRLSSPHLSKNFHNGILSTGCNIIDIGVVPSPLVYFAAMKIQSKSGAVITGSHNPSDDNGIKTMIQGRSLSANEIQDLYQRVITKNFKHGQGQVKKTDFNDQYILEVCDNIKLKRKLKVVIDCGNGTAGIIAPELYSRMGCDVIPLYAEVDGNFPNHHPDPSVPENLKDLILSVKKYDADIGLAFDGDSDRLGVITNQGEIVWPDRQLILYALDILNRHPSATIIYDVKCSSNVKKIIEEHGGEALMWKTGHSLIKEKLRETGGLLAGEMSGHIFFKDRWYGFDDALYCGARLLNILSQHECSSNQLFSKIPDSVVTPEIKVAVDDGIKFDLVQRLINKAKDLNFEMSTVDGLRVEFQHGWGLVRASNTTPFLTLRFEADSNKNLNEIKAIFRSLLLSEAPDLLLSF